MPVPWKEIVRSRLGRLRTISFHGTGIHVSLHSGSLESPARGSSPTLLGPPARSYGICGVTESCKGWCRWLSRHAARCANSAQRERVKGCGCRSSPNRSRARPERGPEPPELDARWRFSEVLHDLGARATSCG